MNRVSVSLISSQIRKSEMMLQEEIYSFSSHLAWPRSNSEVACVAGVRREGRGVKRASKLSRSFFFRNRLFYPPLPPRQTPPTQANSEEKETTKNSWRGKGYQVWRDKSCKEKINLYAFLCVSRLSRFIFLHYSSQKKYASFLCDV